MNTVSLALRNLLRNRRRSLTTLLAMTVGLVAVLLFGGYRSSIVHGSLTGFVQYSGHLQIQRKGYFLDGGDNPTAYGIANYQSIINAVKKDPVLAPMLVVVTPTLQLGGLAGNFSAGLSRSVMAAGLVPEEHNLMHEWNEYGVVSYAKSLPLVGSGHDAVVVGEGVARRLQLCASLNVPNCDQAPVSRETEGKSAPGDILALSSLERSSATVDPENRIEMLVSSARGAPNVASLTVIKANNMGVKAIDDVYLAMHLSQAQKLIYGKAAPQVTAIILQLQHTDQLPEAQHRLKELLDTEFKDGALDVLDFATLSPMYNQTKQFMDSMFSFISMLIGVIVLFTIGNTMSTAVVERTVEIGTLRAMGQRRAGIRRLFITEALLLGLAGIVIGLLAALFLAYLINHSGWAWTPPGYSYAYLIQVRVGEDTSLLIGSMLGTLAVTVLSAWWPANRASRLMIVDALRHV